MFNRSSKRLNMQVILLSLAVVLLVSEVNGFFEIHGSIGVGRGNGRQTVSNPRPHGRTFGGQCRGDHHNLFPMCKDFMKEVHNKLRETDSGLRTWRSVQDCEECKFQKMMKARMALNCQPSEACLSQIHNFLSGTSCDKNSGESTFQ